MGIKEGASMAASAAAHKAQVQKQLSDEEKSKIMMEIAKMGHEMKINEFKMNKETHEMQMQKAQFDQQMGIMQKSQMLMDMAKKSKLDAVYRNTYGDMNQFRMAGSGQVNYQQMAENMLQQGGEAMEPKERQYWQGVAQPGQDKEHKYPYTEEEAKGFEAYKAKLKAQTSTSTPKPPTKAQALSKIAQLTASKAKFGMTNKIDIIAQGLFPQLKQAEQTGDKKAVEEAYDNAIDYYKQFADTKRTKAIAELRAQGMPLTEANIKYTEGLLE